MKIENMVSILVLLASLGIGQSAQAEHTLRAHGDPLSPARGLRSASNKFWVQMQGDENLVVYGNQSKPCWASNTMRAPADNPNADPRLILTEDELAIWVRDPRSQKFSKRKVLANRGSGPKFSFLIMQDDGNLVLYDVSHSSSKNGAKFATGEAKHKDCRY